MVGRRREFEKSLTCCCVGATYMLLKLLNIHDVRAILFERNVLFSVFLAALRRMKKLQASLFDDLIHHGLGLRLDVEKYLPRPPALDEVPINHFRQDHHDIFPES